MLSAGLVSGVDFFFCVCSLMALLVFVLRAATVIHHILVRDQSHVFVMRVDDPFFCAAIQRAPLFLALQERLLIGIHFVKWQTNNAEN